MHTAKRAYGGTESNHMICCVGACAYEEEVTTLGTVGSREGSGLCNEGLPLQALNALQRARWEGCWAGSAHDRRTSKQSGPHVGVTLQFQCGVTRVDAELRLQKPARDADAYAYAAYAYTDDDADAYADDDADAYADDDADTDANADADASRY